MTDAVQSLAERTDRPSSEMKPRLIVFGVAVAATALAASRGLALAHAMLLSSEPGAGSVLTHSPARVRLRFSEAVNARVSGISITGPSGLSRALEVQGDSTDAAALVAPVDVLGPGGYRVVWRTVSVDGHRVDGVLLFSIRGDSAHSAAVVSPPPPPAPADTGALGPALFGAPLIAAGLRGIALGCLMAFAGLLFFVRRVANATRGLIVSRWLGAGAVVALALHLAAWIVVLAPGHHVDAAWTRSIMGTPPGYMEVARLTSAAIALGVLVLMRRDLLALMFATIALVVSGAIGHPAAIHPLVTIPAKALHLCAGAAWLGGLIWLTLADRVDTSAFAREARRVSSVAFVAVVLVLFSGLAQTFNFLVPAANLFRTTYGSIVLVKMAGLLILVAFGAHHRLRELPTLAGPDGGARLRASVRSEIAVFVVVVLAGGLLSYVSPR